MAESKIIVKKSNIQNNAKSNYFDKKKEEKVTQWELLKAEFPALKNVKGAGLFAAELTKAVAEKYSIPLSGITILGGNPYINKVGLLYKAHNDGRKVKKMFTEPVILPINIKSGSDVMLSDDGTAMFRGVVEFENGEVYTDYGTANAKYLTKSYNKMSSMIPYVIELSSTRAMNRAIRLATGVGLVSYEELNEGQKKNDSGVDYEKENFDMVLQKLYKLMKEKNITEAQYYVLCQKHKFNEEVDIDVKKVNDIIADIMEGRVENIDENEKKIEVKKDETEEKLEIVDEIDKLVEELGMTQDEVEKLYWEEKAKTESADEAMERVRDILLERKGATK